MTTAECVDFYLRQGWPPPDVDYVEAGSLFLTEAQVVTEHESHRFDILPGIYEAMVIFEPDWDKVRRITKIYQERERIAAYIQETYQVEMPPITETSDFNGVFASFLHRYEQDAYLQQKADDYFWRLDTPHYAYYHLVNGIGIFKDKEGALDRYKDAKGGSLFNSYYVGVGSLAVQPLTITNFVDSLDEDDWIITDNHLMTQLTEDTSIYYPHYENGYLDSLIVRAL